MTEEKLGFGESRDPNTVYLQVKYFGLCEVSKVEREGFEPHEVQNPRKPGEVTVKFIKRHPSLTAYVDEIEWRDTGDKYDVQFLSWRLHLNAGDFKSILEIDFRSAAASAFAKTAERIDWSRPVEFRAFRDTTRPNATAFLIAQGGEVIKWKYTKDEPGDCPPPVKGVSGWSFGAQEQFLWEMMMNKVLPACAAAAAARQGEHPAETATQGTQNPASEPEAPETTRWTPPSTAKPAETATAPATAAKEPPSELAGIVNKVRMLAAGKGIPNLDAFIKTVLSKDMPVMSTVEEATEVLNQLKAL